MLRSVQLSQTCVTSSSYVPSPNILWGSRNWGWTSPLKTWNSSSFPALQPYTCLPHISTFQGDLEDVPPISSSCFHEIGLLNILLGSQTRAYSGFGMLELVGNKFLKIWAAVLCIWNLDSFTISFITFYTELVLMHRFLHWKVDIWGFPMIYYKSYKSL